MAESKPDSAHTTKAVEHNDTDLMAVASALAAGDADFGVWLVTCGARLPVDFELAF